MTDWLADWNRICGEMRRAELGIERARFEPRHYPSVPQVEDEIERGEATARYLEEMRDLQIDRDTGIRRYGEI